MKQGPLFSSSKVGAIVVLVCLVGSLVAFTSVTFGPPPSPAPTIRLVDEFPFLSFNQPVGIYHAGDNSNLLFVLERAGTIRTFTDVGTTFTASVFLDITDRVNSVGPEEGLLGLAFHLNYTSNGYFYVDYTAANPQRTVIARYQVDPGNLREANKSSEHPLLQISQPFANHNGGQLAFGSDGYLYIAMGDGGGTGDPYGNAQNLTSLLGKVLRIDVDHTSPGLDYSIPADNPYAGNTLGYRDEIYAYGLRNPWRFSFDPEKGTIWAGDAGQDDWEEVDIIQRGSNYGWNFMEGNHSYPPGTSHNATGLEPPVWEYAHSIGQTIIGGFVYRGKGVPYLYEKYVCGSFETGMIWSLQYYNTTSPVSNLLIDSGLLITSFGVDQNGELYVCDLNGKIYAISAVETGMHPTTASLQISLPR